MNIKYPDDRCLSGDYDDCGSPRSPQTSSPPPVVTGVLYVHKDTADEHVNSMDKSPSNKLELVRTESHKQLAVPIAELLRGESGGRPPYVDARFKIPHFPSVDMVNGIVKESAREGGGDPLPLIIFLLTDRAIDGLPDCSVFDGRTGVFTCPPCRSSTYKKNPLIKWLVCDGDIEQIQAAEDVLLETAKVSTNSILHESRLIRLVSELAFYSRPLFVVALKFLQCF